MRAQREGGAGQRGARPPRATAEQTGRPCGAVCAVGTAAAGGAALLAAALWVQGGGAVAAAEVARQRRAAHTLAACAAGCLPPTAPAGRPPECCSGHGRCALGRCVCSAGFAGSGCSRCAAWARGAWPRCERDWGCHALAWHACPALSAPQLRGAVGRGESLAARHDGMLPGRGRRPVLLGGSQQGGRLTVRVAPGLWGADTVSFEVCDALLCGSRDRQGQRACRWQNSSRLYLRHSGCEVEVYRMPPAPGPSRPGAGFKGECDDDAVRDDPVCRRRGNRVRQFRRDATWRLAAPAAAGDAWAPLRLPALQPATREGWQMARSGDRLVLAEASGAAAGGALSLLQRGWGGAWREPRCPPLPQAVR
eukprot:TRINITY_DN46162_c0_g1_i2.p1 TRINITY_DN46162_c0_g1~~TRINITY_DN46162_c0_g1_i2.p1  ORF type:complete len:365 (+),score=71.78 TRINITY_DN46162_c0_g1_i2:71-1165(+)